MTNRPNVSVCMAAYNGEKYIGQQLESILPQLGREDEVVIVDDASTDVTRDRIRAFADPRIRLIEHACNQGVSRTFEVALRNAHNEIIFLSDQDDIWVPDKVSTVLQVFAEHPETTLVAGDASLINEEGVCVADSYFRPRGKFSAGVWANLVRNRFGGCTMAFRATILDEVLPFPHRYGVLHDSWIGIRNTLCGGKVAYIDRPLILNRRHSTTATGRESVGVIRKLDLRLRMILALADFSLRRRWKLQGSRTEWRHS